MMSSKKIMFGLLALTVLGAGVVASADKAAKPAKGCAACCMPKKKTQAAKPASAKPATPKAKAASATRTAKPAAGKTMKPVASAGWIYRDPGSPMPKGLGTRSVITPRIQAAKDPRNGVSMILPPMTASVATVDADGRVNYDCKPGAGHSHQADKNHK